NLVYFPILMNGNRSERAGPRTRVCSYTQLRLTFSSAATSSTVRSSWSSPSERGATSRGRGPDIITGPALCGVMNGIPFRPSVDVWPDVATVATPGVVRDYEAAAVTSPCSYSAYAARMRHSQNGLVLREERVEFTKGSLRNQDRLHEVAWIDH